MGKFFEFRVPLLDQFGLCNPYGATISDCGAQLICWWMKSSTTNYICILLLHSTVIKGKICQQGHVSIHWVLAMWAVFQQSKVCFLNSG